MQFSNRKSLDEMQKFTTVRTFLLSYSPTIDVWYWLFDPGHNRNETNNRGNIENGKPVVFVNWYDAWVFCKWAHWNGESCRLPFEDEWEYAAKAGKQWDWNYWWGDSFKRDKCNCKIDDGVFELLPPSEKHTNPFGLQDILGNVMEWCEDEYRIEYSRNAQTGNTKDRVMRGGSWDLDEYFSRSAKRLAFPPACSYRRTGFRVARNF